MSLISHQNICRYCMRYIRGSLLQVSGEISSASSIHHAIPRRDYATGWKRRIMREEELQNHVYQYAGKHRKKADRVYGWGYAATGALGVRRFLKPEKHQSARKIQLVPHRVDFFDAQGFQPYDVACGYGFTVFLCKTERGQRIVASGINTDSQLGYQEYPIKSGRILDYVIELASLELPLTEPDTTKLLTVACGRAHTLIVTDTEGIFSLGNNAYGQCGRDSVEGELYRGSQTINKVSLDKKVQKVVCGQDHSLFLTDEGEVYSCGLGADGQTGLGTYEAVGIPRKLEGDIAGKKILHLDSKADCVLAASGVAGRKSVVSQLGADLLVVDRGDEDGEVFGWGNSEYNQLASVAADLTQLNTPTKLPFQVGKVTRVATSGTMCALLNESGEVFVWGFGIIGKGPSLEQSMWPTRIPPTLFGRNRFTPNHSVVDIKAFMNGFAALTNQGELYVWGRNKTACLGLGHQMDQLFPFKVLVPAEVTKVATGVDHTVVLCKTFA